MVLFEAKGLGFVYPLGNKRALNQLDFKVNKGEFVLVMGRSGGGKTTLLKLLSQSLAPVGALEGELKSVAKTTGYVNQNPDLTFVSGRVRGELAFALENQGFSDSEISVRIGELASFFNLTEYIDCELSSLSGGVRSAVAIASAIIGGAEVLLLDEPYSQLDPKACTELTSLLGRINTELGITVIMSSHTSQDVIELCDRLLILENGSAVFDGTPNTAAKIDALLPYLPVFTGLFEERPLTVKAALQYSDRLREKPTQTNLPAEVSVEVKSVTFAYSKKGRDILSSLNYEAYSGCVNAIIGANSSGKTTLLKVLAGIKKPYSGRVRLNSKAAYMPQNVTYLFSRDSVREEISEPTAELLGLTDCIDSNPLDLSGGEAQRLALGILLEQDADILLLDEPTKSLDSFAKLQIAEILKSLCADGKTVIIVSHDLDFIGSIAERVSFLFDGSIAMTGGRRETFSKLGYYTTQIRRITRGKLASAVSTEDLV